MLTIKSVRETSSMTTQQPPSGKVLRLDVDGYIPKKFYPVVRWDFFMEIFYKGFKYE